MKGYLSISCTKDQRKRLVSILRSMGVNEGDYDGDGWLLIWLSETGKVWMYRSCNSWNMSRFHCRADGMIININDNKTIV